MHNSNPEEFARLLDAAADHVAKQRIHPGQTLPGLWPINKDTHEPARLIGVIVTLALANACRDADCDLTKALESYAEVSKDVTIVPKGGPDVMAAQHLRDAATELRRVGALVPADA